MSPRAAWRLESLGFSLVYDYVAGKADWFANGLDTEGTLATLPRVGQFARKDVPRCRLDESIQVVQERIREANWDTCVVVNNAQVVLGLLRESDLHSSANTTVEQNMRSGPATFRPDALLAEVIERMNARNVRGVLVTLSGGVLVGFLRSEDMQDNSVNNVL